MSCHWFRVWMGVAGLVSLVSAPNSIISFTGPAGQSCLTSSGLLGNCVGRAQCRISGAASRGCPTATVCCLRVSGPSRAGARLRPVQIRPTQVAPAPTPTQVTPAPTPTPRKLCTYIRPVPQSVALLARSGRRRRGLGWGSASTFRRHMRQPFRRLQTERRLSGPYARPGLNIGPNQRGWRPSRPNTRPGRPSTRPGRPNTRPGRPSTRPTPPPGLQFFINGENVPGTRSQGTGVVSSVARPPSQPSLNDVFDRLMIPPARPARPPNSPITFISSPQSVASQPQFETYVDFCIN